jgi:hypothetical protein
VVYRPQVSGDVTLKGIEPRAWRASWIDPRAGTAQGAGPVDVGIDLTWRAPSAPSDEDWLLVVTADRGAASE